MVDKLKGLLVSRRFWAAMLGSALTYLNSNLKIMDDATMLKIVGLISAWIIGDSLNKTSAPNG